MLFYTYGGSWKAKSQMSPIQIMQVSDMSGTHIEAETAQYHRSTREGQGTTKL